MGLKEEKKTKTKKPNTKRAKHANKKDNKFKTWWKNRSGVQKALMIIAIIILVLVIAVGAFFYSKLTKIGPTDDFTGDEEIVEELEVDEINSITDADSLNDICKQWATNGGTLMSQSYVKNILLLGVDSDYHLSDSMILASLNENTKTITLVSFMRDSYTYIQPSGKTPRFNKLNAAYSCGGVTCLIDTIQNDFKIKIDDYAIVDYKTFPKVIDALGGVDVNVTEKEAKFLNSTWKRWTRTGNKVSYKTGINHLNGEKALMFCRIRKLDSDNNRTERQRRVITAIMKSFKDANLSQLNKAINAVLPNIKTDMTKTQITSYASSAISKGWLKYEIKQTQCPSDKTSKAGTSDKGKWIWIVDYEGAAYELQTLLYGTSNIELSPDRVSALSLKAKSTVTKVATTKKSSTTTTTKTTEATTEATTGAEDTTSAETKPVTESNVTVENTTTQS